MRAIALNSAGPAHSSVEMETQVGRLRGTWRGATEIAQGDSVDVELELPRLRTVAEIVFGPSEDLASGLIRGTVAAVFDDGVFVLQIGSAAVQVELDGDALPGEHLGATVGLEADDLEFYPSGV